MSAEDDDAAREAAQADIAAERGGISSPAAEVARLHREVDDLRARVTALETP